MRPIASRSFGGIGRGRFISRPADDVSGGRIGMESPPIENVRASRALAGQDNLSIW
jgi:hypothetical protein